MIFLKTVNPFMMTSEVTQPEPLPQPSPRLCGKQIHMYRLYEDHRQFAITSEDKYQDQLTLIQSIQKQRLTINKVSIRKFI